MINKKWNKQGASLSGITEMMIGIVVIMLCFGFIVAGMNHDYGKTFDSSFGLGQGFNANSTKIGLEGYQNTLGTGMEGEATTNAINGVNVVSSWGVIRSGISMVGEFITGGFITNAMSLLHFGSAGIALGWALRLLFIFALGFIFIKILFKVKP